MTVQPVESVETGLTREPGAGLDALADLAMPERDYANDYATYWQARSGFFDRVPEGERAHDRR